MGNKGVRRWAGYVGVTDTDEMRAFPCKNWDPPQQASQVQDGCPRANAVPMHSSEGGRGRLSGGRGVGLRVTGPCPDVRPSSGVESDVYFPGVALVTGRPGNAGPLFPCGCHWLETGPSCEPRPPPPLLLHESPDPRPVGICICCHVQAPTTPGPPCQGSG